MDTEDRSYVQTTTGTPVESNVATAGHPDPSAAIPLDEAWEQLRHAVDSRDEMTFVLASRRIDWSQRTADDVVTAVRWALAAGAHMLARTLSAGGVERFPAHPELAKMAHVLAPPRVLGTSPPDPSVRVDTEWLRAHSDEYRGQYVALQHGKLLAAAPTVREIIETLGDLRGRGILLTRVF